MDINTDKGIEMDKKALTEFVESRLADTEYFLVDLSVSAVNEIKVEVDSFGDIDIDFCVALSKAIEEAFPRDDEDYELEVGSAGFTSPFKVRKQYEKNLDNEVEVQARDGKKYIGTLMAVDDDGFSVSCVEKVKEPGQKRPVEKRVDRAFAYADVNSVRYHFEF